ncbi:MAG: hypothetical protein QXX38_03285 [Candidatus Aenigmatarchaeota archaeon]
MRDEQIINLDKGLGRNEIKYLSEALYGNRNLVVKGGDTKILFCNGEAEFLSLPSNAEEFEKDVSILYDSLAKYGNRKEIEKLADKLNEIDFVTVNGKDIPIKREDFRTNDIFSFAQKYGERIVYPWDSDEKISIKPQTKKSKATSKITSLGLIGGLIGSLFGGLALGYLVSKATIKSEEKTVTHTETIFSPVTKTTTEKTTLTQTFIKNYTKTTTTEKTVTTTLPAPCREYAAQLGIDKNLFSYIKPFDADGKMNATEKEFIDVLAQIGNLINDSYPELKNYWTKKELTALQEEWCKSVLEDGKISPLELNATKRILSWDRLNVIYSIINSSMINDRAFNKDWDKDNLTNISEIMNGSNPLNELETDPKNRSEVYCVNIAGPGWINSEDYGSFKDMIIVYHLQRKFGIPKKIIFLFADNRILLEDKIAYAPNDLRIGLIDIYIDKYKHWNNKSLLTDFGPVNFYKLGKFSAGDILNLASQLNSQIDKNDVVVISISGHMGDLDDGGFLWGGRKETEQILVNNYHINQFLSKINYGRALVLLEGCENQKFASNLNVPSPLHDTIAIASGTKEKPGQGFWMEAVWEYLASGYSLKQTGEKLLAFAPYLNFLPYYFKKDVHDHYECPWMNYFNPLIYLPKEKD